MTKGVAHAAHALPAELLQREDNGRAGTTHPLEARVDVSDTHLKDDRRPAKRRRRVAVPGARFLGHREGRVFDGEVGVRDRALTRGYEARRLRGAEGLNVELDGASCVPDDQQGG